MHAWDVSGSKPCLLYMQKRPSLWQPISCALSAPASCVMVASFLSMQPDKCLLSQMKSQGTLQNHLMEQIIVQSLRCHISDCGMIPCSPAQARPFIHCLCCGPCHCPMRSLLIVYIWTTGMKECRLALGSLRSLDLSPEAVMSRMPNMCICLGMHEANVASC